MATTATLGSTGTYMQSLTFGGTSGGILYGLDFNAAVFRATGIYTLNLSTGLATLLTTAGSTGLSSLVTERSTAVYPAPPLQTAVEDVPNASSSDIELLLNRENEIKARYLMIR